MTKIVTIEQMRATETAADAAGLSYAEMMNRAGRVVADHVKQLLEDSGDTRVAILVGKGNNGGDGLVAGSLIAAETKAIVSFFLVEARDASDPLFAAIQSAGLLAVDAATDGEQGYRVLRTMVANADMILDAILGTGAHLPIAGDLEKILRQVDRALKERAADHPRPHLITPNQPSYSGRRNPFILAIDVPSGLDADSGALDPLALHADATITFEAAKPGLLSFPGADAVGTLHIASLGIPDKTEPLASITNTLVDAPYVHNLLPKRPANSSKGTFGKAMIAAGSVNYSGAAALSALGAYRIGAGLVTVAAPQPVVPSLAGHLLEATWLLLPHDMGVLSKGAARALRKELAGYSALLIGPGLTQEEPTAEFISALFQSETPPVKVRTGFGAAPEGQSNADAPKVKPRAGFGFAPSPIDAPEDKNEPDVPLPPLVIDADGLNLLAKIDDWWTRLPAHTIITPHPGEFARLAKIEDEGGLKANERVQANRVALAIEKAAAWKVIVLLKGAHTVIADPDGRVAILPFANPGLAHAGTGDVLAGMIVGLLAQGLAPFDAAILAGYVHGYAGELAVMYSGNPTSVLASDVAQHVGDALTAIEAAGA